MWGRQDIGELSNLKLTIQNAPVAPFVGFIVLMQRLLDKRTIRPRSTMIIAKVAEFVLTNAQSKR